MPASDAGPDPGRTPATVRWLDALWRGGDPPTGTWIALEGGSMSPTLWEGDHVLVRPFTGPTPPSPGEIVVARRGPRLVTHRLVSRDGELAITRGDACPTTDPPIPIRMLLGRVVAIRRGSRWTARWRRARRIIDRLRRSM